MNSNDFSDLPIPQPDDCFTQTPHFNGGIPPPNHQQQMNPFSQSQGFNNQIQMRPMAMTQPPPFTFQAQNNQSQLPYVPDFPGTQNLQTPNLGFNLGREPEEIELEEHSHDINRRGDKQDLVIESIAESIAERRRGRRGYELSKKAARKRKVLHEKRRKEEESKTNLNPQQAATSFQYSMTEFMNSSSDNILQSLIQIYLNGLSLHHHDLQVLDTAFSKSCNIELFNKKIFSLMTMQSISPQIYYYCTQVLYLFSETSQVFKRSARFIRENDLGALLFQPMIRFLGIEKGVNKTLKCDCIKNIFVILSNSIEIEPNIAREILAKNPKQFFNDITFNLLKTLVEMKTSEIEDIVKTTVYSICITCCLLLKHYTWKGSNDGYTVAKFVWNKLIPFFTKEILNEDAFCNLLVVFAERGEMFPHPDLLHAILSNAFFDNKKHFLNSAGADLFFSVSKHYRKHGKRVLVALESFFKSKTNGLCMAIRNMLDYELYPQGQPYILNSPFAGINLIMALTHATQMPNVSNMLMHTNNGGGYPTINLVVKALSACKDSDNRLELCFLVSNLVFNNSNPLIFLKSSQQNQDLVQRVYTEILQTKGAHPVAVKGMLMNLSKTLSTYPPFTPQGQYARNIFGKEKFRLEIVKRLGMTTDNVDLINACNSVLSQLPKKRFY
jgi:hypothetical protein